MNKKVKTSILIVVSVLLLALTGVLVSLTKHAYDEYLLNYYNVQERLYEAVSMFYAYLLMLVFCFSLLVISACGLIHTLRPVREAGKPGLFIRRNGLYLTLGFLVVFVVLFVLDRAAVGRIANMAETSEVPATLRDRILSGRLRIGAVLAAEGTLLSLAAWIHQRKQEKRG